jgi:hypothetical protein
MDISYQPPVVAAPPKRRRRLAIVISAVVAGVVLLAGGGAVAVWLLNRPTGEDAVRGYFDKLAAGDAAGALTYVLPPANGSYEDEPLLTDDQLADEANRPTNLVVVSSEQFARRNGGVGEYVTVTYTIGDDDYSQEITAVQPESGQPFLLDKPFFDLRIEDDGSWTYVVNGVPATALPLLAFPGVYTATRDGNVLFADATAEAQKVEVGELPARFRFRFSSTQADGAQEAVQAAVNAHLDRCVQDHSMTPMIVDPNGQSTACPFGLRGDAVLQVTWSIGRYPEITITGDDTQVEFKSVAKGLIRYDLPSGWKDDQFEFDIVGWATAAGSTVNVYTRYTH